MATAMDRCLQSTDVLLEILQRLPTSSLRRARLVCRLWRDVVTERTAEMQNRPKPLIWDPSWGAAHVIHDLSSPSCAREFWRMKGNNNNVDRRSSSSWYCKDVQLVGTCNGLLCLCDNVRASPGGDVTLVNPVSGETLAVPPLPCAGLFVGASHRAVERWDRAYSFAYHPTTGRYKVVHVPCNFDRSYEFGAVHVLTLGGATWREVPPPPGAAAKCNLAVGIVSVDGVTYWITAGGAARVVSFDLDTERFASTVTPLPSFPARCYHYHLMEVHGRLGLLACGRSDDVWVLEEGRQWSRRYIVEGQYVPRPIFVYGGYILTQRGASFFAHQRKDTPPLGWRLPCDDVVRVGHRDQGTQVGDSDRDYRTFAYVETTEPLNCYATN